MTKNKPKPAVFIASDHAGLALKAGIKRILDALGYRVRDFGADAYRKSDDYPNFIIPCAEAVAKSGGRALGIVIGGSGNGECMAANKVRGVRAALCYDLWTARKARQHNDANVLCLGARTPSGRGRSAAVIVKAWLKTPFGGDSRHRRRLSEISRYESR